MNTAEDLPGTLDGLVFDLDGTLYHMKWFMRPLLIAQLLPHIRRLPRYMSVRGELMGVDMGSGDRLMRELSIRLGKREKSEPEKMAEWIRLRFYPAFVKLMPLLRDSRPGLDRTVKVLRTRGIATAVVSDFDRIPERLLKLGHDPSAFDDIRSTEKEGMLKPSARVLSVLARRWRAAPERVLVVGDRDDTDGAAARAAGMPFVRITDRRLAPGGTAIAWTCLREYLEAVTASAESSRGS